MSELNRPLHTVLREARRRAGMTQAALAGEVKCKQSAISMFEAGRTDALARDKVRRIAELLGVELGSEARGKGTAGQARLKLKFCPTDDCPSNVPYAVRGEVCIQPRMDEVPEGEARRCRLCGEILLELCPNEECKADVVEGGFCPKCGCAYVMATRDREEDPVRWADTQRERIREVRDMTVTVRYREGGQE